MVGTTAFQNGSFQRVTCDAKLAVESKRFEKRQLRLPQSKCRVHRRVEFCPSDVVRLARGLTVFGSPMFLCDHFASGAISFAISIN